MLATYHHGIVGIERCGNLGGKSNPPQCRVRLHTVVGIPRNLITHTHTQRCPATPQTELPARCVPFVSVHTVCRTSRVQLQVVRTRAPGPLRGSHHPCMCQQHLDDAGLSSPPQALNAAPPHQSKPPRLLTPVRLIQDTARRERECCVCTAPAPTQSCWQALGTPTPSTLRTRCPAAGCGGSSPATLPHSARTRLVSKWCCRRHRRHRGRSADVCAHKQH